MKNKIISYKNIIQSRQLYAQLSNILSQDESFMVQLCDAKSGICLLSKRKLAGINLKIVNQYIEYTAAMFDDMKKEQKPSHQMKKIAAVERTLKDLYQRQNRIKQITSDSDLQKFLQSGSNRLDDFIIKMNVDLYKYKYDVIDEKLDFVVSNLSLSQFKLGFESFSDFSKLIWNSLPNELIMQADSKEFDNEQWKKFLQKMLDKLFTIQKMIENQTIRQNSLNIIKGETEILLSAISDLFQISAMQNV
jgi:hypothetical protein